MTESPWPTIEPDAGFEALVTDRLTIRRFTASDAPALAAYRSVPDVARYQSWDAPYGEDQAHRFVAELASSHPDTPGEWFQFAVTETASGRLLGDVAASSEADARLARIGFTLAPEAQGRGFATEAVTALLDYLFHTRRKHGSPQTATRATSRRSCCWNGSGCGAKRTTCRACGRRASGPTSTSTRCSQTSGPRVDRRRGTEGSVAPPPALRRLSRRRVR